jgi:hypothetical protein
VQTHEDPKGSLVITRTSHTNPGIRLYTNDGPIDIYLRSPRGRAHLKANVQIYAPANVAIYRHELLTKRETTDGPDRPSAA